MKPSTIIKKSQLNIQQPYSSKKWLSANGYNGQSRYRNYNWNSVLCSPVQQTVLIVNKNMLILFKFIKCNETRSKNVIKNYKALVIRGSETSYGSGKFKGIISLALRFLICLRFWYSLPEPLIIKFKPISDPTFPALNTLSLSPASKIFGSLMLSKIASRERSLFLRWYFIHIRGW